jgi:hypothetical protein
LIYIRGAGVGAFIALGKAIAGHAILTNTRGAAARSIRADIVGRAVQLIVT